ncbi:phosphoinositide phosphatase family protein [Actinidia rufa]|uniref:Phosphoinositide phosphatase family protein n=1 Tax=Actinidia rufa TaxID=165716 RepID=A0A7J0DK47_9ERIC|nr:phosphoinositide phosphatase family protein [Actinidia rufa]
MLEVLIDNKVGSLPVVVKVIKAKNRASLEENENSEVFQRSLDSRGSDKGATGLAGLSRERLEFAQGEAESLQFVNQNSRDRHWIFAGATDVAGSSQDPRGSEMRKFAATGSAISRVSSHYKKLNMFQIIASELPSSID